MTEYFSHQLHPTPKILPNLLFWSFLLGRFGEDWVPTIGDFWKVNISSPTPPPQKKTSKIHLEIFYLVVSTGLKNISQIGSSPQVSCVSLLIVGHYHFVGAYAEATACLRGHSGSLRGHKL